jgi:hypothetical protein
VEAASEPHGTHDSLEQDIHDPGKEVQLSSVFCCHGSTGDDTGALAKFSVVTQHTTRQNSRLHPFNSSSFSLAFSHTEIEKPLQYKNAH